METGAFISFLKYPAGIRKTIIISDYGIHLRVLSKLYKTDCFMSCKKDESDLDNTGKSGEISAKIFSFWLTI